MAEQTTDELLGIIFFGDGQGQYQWQTPNIACGSAQYKTINAFERLPKEMLNSTKNETFYFATPCETSLSNDIFLVTKRRPFSDFWGRSSSIGARVLVTRETLDHNHTAVFEKLDHLLTQFGVNKEGEHANGFNDSLWKIKAAQSDACDQSKDYFAHAVEIIENTPYDRKEITIHAVGNMKYVAKHGLYSTDPATLMESIKHHEIPRATANPPPTLTLPTPIVSEVQTIARTEAKHIPYSTPWFEYGTSVGSMLPRETPKPTPAFKGVLEGKGWLIGSVIAGLVVMDALEQHQRKRKHSSWVESQQQAEPHRMQRF